MHRDIKPENFRFKDSDAAVLQAAAASRDFNEHGFGFSWQEATESHGTVLSNESKIEFLKRTLGSSFGTWGYRTATSSVCDFPHGTAHVSGLLLLFSTCLLVLSFFRLNSLKIPGQGMKVSGNVLQYIDQDDSPNSMPLPTYTRLRQSPSSVGRTSIPTPAGHAGFGAALLCCSRREAGFKCDRVMRPPVVGLWRGEGCRRCAQGKIDG